MRVVLQRSKNASVTVDDQITGAIDKGYVLLVGITHSDTIEDIQYVAKKIADLRIWEDEEGKMNRAIHEVGGSILSVSQFTLYADTKKGSVRALSKPRDLSKQSPCGTPLTKS